MGLFGIVIGVNIDRNFEQVVETPYFVRRPDSSCHAVCENNITVLATSGGYVAVMTFICQVSTPVFVTVKKVS